MTDSKVNLLNRLVDYFLVVGLSEEKEPEIMFTQDAGPVYKPQLIDRYPTMDYEDIPFPPGVEIFCIPQGVIPKTTIELPTFHHFAATLGNGDRLHGTCLRFYEPVPEKLLPKIREHIENMKSEGWRTPNSESATNEKSTSAEVAQRDEECKHSEDCDVGNSILSSIPRATPIPSTENKNGKNSGNSDPIDSVDLDQVNFTLEALPAPERKSKFIVERRTSSIVEQGCKSGLRSRSDIRDEEEEQCSSTKDDHTVKERIQEDDVDKDVIGQHILQHDQSSLPSPASPPPPMKTISSDVDSKAARTKAITIQVRAANSKEEEAPPNIAAAAGGGGGGGGGKTDQGGGSRLPLPATNANIATTTAAAPEESTVFRKTANVSGGMQQQQSHKKKKDVIYATKCICIVSHYGFFTQYLDFLRELYRISLSPSKTPMERYIVNFARETPLPPRGCLEIKYKIGQQELIFSRPPPNAPIDSPPFPLLDLFRVITPETAVRILTALLLEARVVLVSTPYSNLTLVSELITRLMYPFAYEHVYIPILPKTLMDFLAAPMPFCIGIPRDFLEVDDLREVLRDKEDMLLVDLDNNEIHSTADLTPIPPAELKKLYKRLRPLNRMYRARHIMSSLEMKAFRGRDSAFNYIPSPEELDNLNQSLPVIDDGEITSVQGAFLRVFVSLFKDYRKYLVPRRPPSATPSNTTSEGGSTAGTEKKTNIDSRFVENQLDDEPSFRTRDFLRHQSREAKPFLSRFLETQAFQRFTDQRVAPGPMPGEVENYDIKFFDESIIAKYNRSRFRFSKPTPFLNDKTFDVKESLPAPDPDISGLPQGRIYQHTYFPRLDPNLFQAKRRSLKNEPLLDKLKHLNPAVLPAGSSQNRHRKKRKDSLRSIPELVKHMSVTSQRSKTGRVASRS